MISIRTFQPEDAPGLLRLFQQTVHRINCRDYDEEQLNAWAPMNLDLHGWATRFQGRIVVVAEENGQLVGFGELTPSGKIDRFYVSADHQGRGIGHSLMLAILEEAKRLNLKTIQVEASVTAKNFFAAHGFQEIADQVVRLRNVDFRNYLMICHIKPNSDDEFESSEL